MAQLGCVFPFGEHAQDFNWISAQMPFGIGQVSTLEMRRIETLEDCAAWQRRVQEIVMANSPHQIPAIFHMEGLCGAFFQDSTSFPSGIARGAGWDPELEEEIARTVSRQEAACGITQIFAPVLDVTRDPRMGRQGESYGEDPTLAASLGAAYTRGIQNTETAGRRPESVAKHFLAFQNSQGGIHGTHSDTPPRLLREIYAKPFQAAINAGLKGIMPCYDSLNGEPVSASKELLTGLLREEMRFDGLCVSDYGAVGNAHSVQHIGESFAEAGYRCMEAGMDMELPSTTGWNDELKEMFASDEADIAVLDRAVLRVLEAKFRMGLFEHPFALQGEELRAAFSDPYDRELSLRSARESLVLLKNDGALPLRKTVKKIALIGPHADCARKFFGGYTHLCMMESTLAVANSIAGVSGVVTDGRPIQTIPGTNIQSDEGEEFDAILCRQKPDCRSLLDNLWLLSECIDIRQPITVTYYRMDRKEVKHRLLPVAILFTEYYFYLLAYKDGAVKNAATPYYFRIDRITKITRHRTTFTLSPAQDFDEGLLRRRSQFMWPGKLRHIRFEFSGPSAQAILDRLPTARIIDVKGKTYTMEAEVYGDGIKMYLLSQGSWVKVLAPQEFVDEMQAEIEKMRRLYK